MHFVCLAANAAAKAIEDKKGSIREQYNFACAIVCLLAKKRAFKRNVEGYCSNKITKILESKRNIINMFECRSEYYPEDLQVNNRNLALSCSHYDDISLKAANAFIKEPSLTVPSWFYNEHLKSSFHKYILDSLNKDKLHSLVAFIERRPDELWSLAYICARALELQRGSFQEQCKFAYESIIGCLYYKCFANSSLLSEVIVKYFNIRYLSEQTSIQENKDLQNQPQSEEDPAKSQAKSTVCDNAKKENKLDDSLSSDTKKDIVSGNKDLATQRISPTTAKDSVSATPKQSPAKTLSDTAKEPVISDLSLESHSKEKDGSQSFANTQKASSTLYQEQEHARAQSLAKAQEQEQNAVQSPVQAQEQHSAQAQAQESIFVRQSEEERIKSAYENLSINRNNFRLLDVSYFNKSALEALEYLEKNIRSLSRVGLSNMSDNIKKPLEDFVCDGLKQNKLYEAAQKIEKQDELLLQTIYAFSWAISHINPNRYEQQIFTLEAIIGCLYFKCFDDAYSSTSAIKSYLNEIKESDGLNDNQASNTQHSNSYDIGSSSSNYLEQDYDYAQDTVNRLNLRDSSVNKVVYNAFKQFTAEQHNYISDIKHYSLLKAKAMELLKTNLSSIVSLSEHMLEENKKVKLNQFVYDKLNEYALYEDAKDLSFKGSLKQQVVNYFSFAMFLAQGNLQEQKIFALEAMLICCYYDGFETIEDYINLYLSESFDDEDELESDAIANQNHEPASQESHELSSDQSNQETKDRFEPDMPHETATKQEHEQDKTMEQSSSQSSISNPDSALKPSSQAINANSSLENAQTIASDNSDQSNQETKDRLEPDMPLETATKPEHEQDKAMEQSSSQSSISKPDSALKPSSQAINANSSLESEQTIASDNSDQSNQETKDRLEPDMPLETATKPEHEQDKTMEQSSSQTSISKPDSILKPSSQAINANSSLENAQTIASDNSDQSNQETKDRLEPDMPLETATKPEHEQDKAMEQSSSQSSISKPDSALKPNSQALNANSSLESAQTIASDNSNQSNQENKDRFDPDMSHEAATKPEQEQNKAMDQSSSQSSISKPDSGLKQSSQAINANSSLESAQTIASQTSYQPKSYLAESSSSSINQSSNYDYGSGSGYRSVSNLGASSAHGNSNSLARNMHSGANSISSGSGNNNNRNTVVVLRRNISANKKGSLTNLGLSEQYAKYANSGLSITRSPQKPYKYLNQRQYNDIQHKSNDLDTPPKTAPRVFTANKPSSSLYEDISNDIRSSKGYNTTTFRPKQNLEAYAPSEEEIFKLSNSNPNSKKHDLSNIRRLCIEENRTPSWFRRKTSWIKDKDNSVFANWLHDVLRDQFDIELTKLSIEQQQLIAQVALGLASSMENAGGEREVQMIYIKNFFRQKFTKEQIESFNKLQDYLDHI